ncbi:MAG TPA: hypothetical protein VFT95_09750 [Micromonosporaceae bacterium]|nr:hypothetical protein [Micromonosporaceae bacterium]
MKATYFAGLAAHLLRQHPDVAKVETLADVGVTGPDWNPGWLKVTFTNDMSVVLNVARTSADNDELSDKRDTFHPEDIDGSAREVPSLQGHHVG